MLHYQYLNNLSSSFHSQQTRLNMKIICVAANSLNKTAATLVNCHTRGKYNSYKSCVAVMM